MDTTLLPADPFAANILARLAQDMTGPASAAARVEMVTVGNGGILGLEAPLREAAMFLALTADLGPEPLRVAARLMSPGPARQLEPLIFAGWSEAGTVLPLHVPLADPATELVGPFRIRLDLTGPQGVLNDTEVRQSVTGVLLSGRMGRLMALLDAETVALRRHARAVGAARHISTAEGNALDRHGGDLGVARLRTRPTLASDGTVSTVDQPEADADYRRRLALYRSVAFPRRAQYDARLGPAGPVADMGFAGALHLLENANPFSVAVSLVSVDADEAKARARRLAFLDYLRKWVLIDPKAALPPARRLSSEDRAGLEALIARLQARVTLTAPDAAMAPDLARGLDRLAGLLEALGIAEKPQLLRALDPDGDPRHAMGLGIAIAPLATATIAAVHQAVQAGATVTDPATRATFRALEPPAAPGDDPTGAWILHACGFRTVHPSAAGELFLSHLGTGALAIAGQTLLHPAAAGGAATQDFAAGFVPAAGAASSAVLAGAQARAAERLPGIATTADPAPPLAAATAPDAAASLRLRAAGLPVIDDWQPIRDALAALPADAWTLLALPADTVTALANGDDAAWRTLGELGADLRHAGAAAAVPLFAPGIAALLVSTVALPVAGANLTGKASTMYRWFLFPIDKPASTPSANGEAPARLTRATGTGTQLVARGAGLYAVVVLGYQRLGGTDPYEVRVEAGDGDLLSFAQYEMLMNMLALRNPAGIEINTWPIRRFHVAADDGALTPLDPSAARTWRRFHRPRRAGSPAPETSHG